MASILFRNELRKELPAWRKEGLVDAATEVRLIERYQLDHDGMSLALLAVYVLGALLIGGGIISFVTWNWETMSSTAKIVVIVAAMLVAHVSGYYLKTFRNSPRLGSALILLGTLIFGADIGLIAQIFNISSTWYGGFGAWAAGAWAAAVLLENTPSAALAIVLGVVWSGGFMDDHESTRVYLPYVVAALAMVPAFMPRSKAIAPLAMCGAFVSFVIGFGEQPHSSELVVAASVCLAALFGVLPLVVRGRDPLGLAPAGTVLGLCALSVTAYLCSFHGTSRDLVLASLHAHVALAPLALGVVAAIFSRGSEKWWRIHPASALILACSAAMLVALIAGSPEIGLTVTANGVLVAMSAAALTVSVRDLRRGLFWGGSFLGGLVIVSRFFELDTELWLKALGFVGAGVAVILIGLSFERRLRAAGAVNVA